MFNQQVETLEQVAFREAGHSVMAYLITEAGLTDAQFLAPTSADDRRSMLTPIEFVSVKPPLHQWSRLTFSLRSLITTPMVLLAGFASTRLQFDRTKAIVPQSSELIRTSLHLFGSYYEEFGMDDMAERDRMAAEHLESAYKQVERDIEVHWLSVEAVVNALIDKTKLPQAELYAIIEKQLPRETKAKVTAIANRTGRIEQEYLKQKEQEMLEKIREMDAMSKIALI